MDLQPPELSGQRTSLDLVPAGEYAVCLYGIEGFLDRYRQRVCRLSFRVTEGRRRGEVVSRQFVFNMAKISELWPFASAIIGAEATKKTTLDDLRRALGMRGTLTVEEREGFAEPSQFVKDGPAES
jgi:hypothetical protein